jgi:hypothetical protein
MLGRLLCKYLRHDYDYAGIDQWGVQYEECMRIGCNQRSYIPNPDHHYVNSKWLNGETDDINDWPMGAKTEAEEWSKIENITYIISWEKDLDEFGDDKMHVKLWRKIQELEDMGFSCDSRDV